tara:strand:+ start:2083 stop:2304 length:222 start_codon:yes stop_codon:yes gene_type:complete
MKVGDLVKSSKDTSLSASVGVVVESWDKAREALGKKLKWVKVLYPSELGKEFAPSDGIFLIREDHLKVLSENR